MKVVAYLRVSTDRQAEEGLGLDVQRAAIKEWARHERHQIVDEFVDAGVSGSNGIESRIALGQALNALRNGDASGLVVSSLDRLARDLVLQETLLRDVRTGGHHTFTTVASENAFLADDPNDPSRRLIRQVLGAVSEYERAMIALRLRAGRRLKHEQGGFAFGSPPFGYRSSKGALVADDVEQAALARARELRTEGRSLRETAETLSFEGHLAKRGGAWHPTTLSRALARSDVDGSTQ
jgi:DNA invertase Pin-like site-specific DNA recombinase